jgi:channel protein (hemolysin III family)
MEPETHAIEAIPGFSEPVSSLSHLGGAVLFAVMAFALFRRSGFHVGRLFALFVFAASSVFLFSMSGVYHLLEPGSVERDVFRRLDHAAIFVLIAGTFTPAHALLFKGFMRYGMLALVWIAAILGVVIKVLWIDDVPEWLSLAMYLALGWLGAFSSFMLWRRTGTTLLFLLRPLLAGALSYTIGAVLEFFRWPVLVPHIVGPHELFHVAVVVGALCHWWFTYRIVDRVVPRIRVVAGPPESEGARA